MHGRTAIVFMKRNVDNTAYAQSNTVLNTFTFGAEIGGGDKIYNGDFFTYTGYTGQAMIAVGDDN